MPANPLIGTWRLISYELRDAAGNVTYPWGAHVTGFITYTEEGRMAVVFSRADRPQHNTADRWGGSLEEKAAAYDSSMAYAGTYDFAGDTVTHHVEVCTFQNRVGTDQVRTVRLEGNRVTLETPPNPQAGAMRVGHLVWERV